MALEKKSEPYEKSKKRFGSRIFFGTLIIIIGACALVWWQGQKPIQGTVSVGKPAPSKNDDQNRERKFYEGKYFTFFYPAEYQEKSHVLSDEGPVKESIFLTAIEGGKKISVVVEERESGNYEASPSFLMREKTLQEYDQEPVSINGLSGFLFKKDTQVFEQTFFFHDDHFVFSVSCSSALTAEGLEKELFEVLGSLKRQKE